MQEEQDQFRLTLESNSDLPSSLQDKLEVNEDFEILSQNYQVGQNFSMHDSSLISQSHNIFDLSINLPKNNLDKIIEVDSENDLSKTTEKSLNISFNLAQIKLSDKMRRPENKFPNQKTHANGSFKKIQKVLKNFEQDLSEEYDKKALDQQTMSFLSPKENISILKNKENDSFIQYLPQVEKQESQVESKEDTKNQFKQIKNKSLVKSSKTLIQRSLSPNEQSLLRNGKKSSRANLKKYLKKKSVEKQCNIYTNIHHKSLEDVYQQNYDESLKSLSSIQNSIMSNRQLKKNSKLENNINLSLDKNHKKSKKSQSISKKQKSLLEQLKQYRCYFNSKQKLNKSKNSKSKEKPLKKSPNKNFTSSIVKQVKSPSNKFYHNLYKNQIYSQEYNMMNYQVSQDSTSQSLYSQKYNFKKNKKTKKSQEKISPQIPTKEQMSIRKLMKKCIEEPVLDYSLYSKKIGMYKKYKQIQLVKIFKKLIKTIILIPILWFFFVI